MSSAVCEHTEESLEKDYLLAWGKASNSKVSFSF